MRILGLVIAFGLAGGATGGIVAAVSLHMKEQASAPALSGVAEVESESAPEQAASPATPNVNAADSEAGQATVVRPQRRSLRRSKPRARLMAIYDDLDFDLAPLKKKQGKRNEYSNKSP